MTDQQHDAGSPPPDAGRFATTQWSLVLRAAAEDAPGSHEALASVCERYWYPLYAYLRRQGSTAQEAEDLTQGFFATLIEKRFLDEVAPGQGRFRSFLLVALRHFASNWRRHERAQKRGGAARRLSLDAASAESRYLLEPAHQESPERLYERHWAETLIAHTLARLKREYEETERGPLFAALMPVLSGPVEDRPYAVIATELGISTDAVKAAVSRMRSRFRLLLRAEVATLVNSSEDVEDELNALLRALSC